ncbi:unnamed protein product, partial [Brassica oleracea var. botrytis]
MECLRKRVEEAEQPNLLLLSLFFLKHLTKFPKKKMSSSSSDGVDEAVEEMFDQEFDNIIDSLVDVQANKPKRRAYIERDREQGHNQLWNDYFKEHPTYPPDMFRRRFRMNKPLFLRIVDRLNNEYLRRPTADDLRRLLDNGEARGFLGMIGSIDCMHWEWKNCPTAWRGQYTRTLNDINVLDRSPVFDDILQGRAPRVNFKVNNHKYRMAYYLTDGIYPNLSTFIQSIPLPQRPKAELFARRQESVRKYVERAFGILQARFAVVKNPALLWDKEKIEKIMKTCVILHNMIVENERDGYTQYDTSDFEAG